jgi:tRNA(Ile)-lysidine synthase
VAKGANLEARARAARYAVFERALAAGDVLLLAHHADDQLETILLRLLRGTDTGRLAMPARRPLGAGWLLRPLLELPRTVLAAAAQRLAQDWIDDPSNEEVDPDRNYLRHNVLPALVARWPDGARRAAVGAQRAAADAALAAAALDAQLPPVGAGLPIAQLAGSHRPRLLRRWLLREGVQWVREAAIAELLDQIAAARAVGVEVRPGTVVRRHRDRLYVVAPEGRFVASSWHLNVPFELPGGRLRARPLGAAQPVTVTVRPWRPGVRIALAGRAGTRRVATLLSAAGIARWRRPGFPLIYVGDDVAVVPGIGVAAPYAAQFATGRGRPAEDAWIIEYETRMS